MSTPEDLIRDGHATLALDTNALRMKDERLLELCDKVRRLSEPPWSLNLRLGVSAVVHMERVRQLQHVLRKRGQTYDPRQLEAGMRRKGLNVFTFDESHAVRTAELITAQYEDDEAWQEAKRKLCRKCLGIDTTSLHPSKQRCSATIDWLIAAQAHQEGWVLITDDQGNEFIGVGRRMKLKALESLLDALLAAESHPPGAE